MLMSVRGLMARLYWLQACVGSRMHALNKMGLPRVSADAHAWADGTLVLTARMHALNKMGLPRVSADAHAWADGPLVLTARMHGFKHACS